MVSEAATERATQGNRVPIAGDDCVKADPSLVRDQLDRVLRSEQFRASARISRFLRYVTEAALEGKTDEIKETSIGVSVYEREPTYDPKIDTVVRSEARRLRKKLDRYFEEEGHRDLIRISLPKGGYVPTFIPVAAVSEMEPAEPTHSAPVVPQTPKAESAEVVPEPQRQRKSASLYLLIALIVLLVVAASFLLVRHTRHQDASGEASRISPLTSFRGESYQPSISPDGKSVAFVWNNGSSVYSVYVMQAGGTPLRVTSGPDSDYHPVWSPDGGSLAFLRISHAGAQVMVTSFPGGSETALFTLKSGRPWSEDELGIRSDAGPIWSSDGKEIIVSDTAVSGRGLGLYGYNLQSHKFRTLTEPSADERDLNPAESPDGRWIAYARFASYDSADIFITSLIDQGTRQLTSDRTDIQGLSWKSDDRGIIFSSNRGGAYGLWGVDIDGGEPSPIMTAGESSIQPAVSRSGDFIVYADSALSSNVVKIDLKRGGAEPAITDVASSTRRSHSGQFSPDGSKIAFVSDRSGKWELWIANSDGRAAAQLTNFDTGTVGSPRWSPDGRSIAFDARPNGHSSVYLVSLDGLHLQNLSANAQEEKQPAWSPDGKWIYFNSNRGGSMQLWRMTSSGSKAAPVSPSASTDVRFSSDGKMLYFTNAGEGLWQMPASGGSPALVAGLEHCRFGRLWTVTDSGIYFVDVETDRSKLMLFDFQTSHSKPVLTLPAEALIGYPSLSYSAAQRAVLFAVKQDQRSNLMTLRTHAHQ